MTLSNIQIQPHVDTSKKADDLGMTVVIDGEKRKAIKYEGKLAKQARGFNLISQDLSQCINWLDINSKEQPIIASALHRAFAITYGKCFTQAKGRGVQLNPDHIFRTAPEASYRDVHDQIMEMRHDFVAHSGSSKFEKVEVSVILGPTGEIDEHSAVGCAVQSFGSYYEGHKKIIQEVVSYVSGQVQHKLRQINEQVKEDLRQELARRGRA